MHPEHRLLEEIVGLRLARREAQAEAIEPGRHQAVHLVEDAIVPPRIALHEFAGLIGARLHANPDVCNLLRRLAEPCGSESRSARSGIGALESRDTGILYVCAAGW